MKLATLEHARAWFIYCDLTIKDEARECFSKGRSKGPSRSAFIKHRQ